ncbi:MAG: methyltransferase domain-containing protein [Elusimicrobia bacterium]|nr:methyltransferase domain-containing protein [Elusimicrobiota bacterium]
MAGPEPIAPEGLHLKAASLLSEERRGEALDLASGQGAFCERLSWMGYKVVACDRDHASFKGGAEFKRVDLNVFPYPYPSEYFQVVSALEIIEHLENPRGFLREIFRLLRPGGVLVLSTPNVLSLYSRLRFFLLGAPNFFDSMGLDERYCYYYRVVGHINPVAWPELRSILEECGFELERVEANGSAEGRLPWFWRMGARWVTGLAALPVWAATWALRRKDPRSMELLRSVFLFGECLVIKARKK